MSSSCPHAGGSMYGRGRCNLREAGENSHFVFPVESFTPLRGGDGRGVRPYTGYPLYPLDPLGK